MPRTLSVEPVVSNGRPPTCPAPKPEVRDRRSPIPEAVWQDHVRLADHGDPDALERLVQEYERYARSLAARLYRRHESREDLDQIALEALVLALRRFDPHRGIPFPAFATPTILGSLRRHYRDHGWLVRVPRPVHELASALREASDRLTAGLGRAPSEHELATELGVELKDLRTARAALHARDTRSLDGTTDDLSLGDRVGAHDPNFDRAESRLAARAAIETLSGRDRQLICRYYIDGLTQSQIAAELGVSQMQVSRLIRSILCRLRQVAA